MAIGVPGNGVPYHATDALQATALAIHSTPTERCIRRRPHARRGILRLADGGQRRNLARGGAPGEGVAERIPDPADAPDPGRSRRESGVVLAASRRVRPRTPYGGEPAYPR